MSTKNRAPRQTRRERRAGRLLDAPIELPEALRGSTPVATETLGLRKMADVLEEFIEPIVATFPDDPDLETLRRVYQVGMAVWNATSPLAPPGQLEQIVDALAEGDDRAAGQQVVDVLVAHRATRFADDRRIIANFELRPERGGPRLVVASVVPKGEAGAKRGA